MTVAPAIRRIERLDLRFASRRWAFAEERRAEIDAHFAYLQRRVPLWNGRVLLMFEHEFSGDTLRGSYLETDFASFVAWRDWDFPDRAMRNCFAPAALRGADGGFVLGVMNAGTANAGKIYFPCGTPDPDDRVGDRVDLAGSAARELQEETGIAAAELDVDPGWYAVLDGCRIALIKLMRAREDAARLQARIRAHIAQSGHPELADAHVVRGPADIVAAMPPFVGVFLRHAWAGFAGRSQPSERIP